MKKLLLLALLALTLPTEAQQACFGSSCSSGGSSGITSGDAITGFTANTLLKNGSGTISSGPKFLSGNLSLEVGTNYCEDAGVSDAYTCNLAGGSLSAYSTGTKITLKANTANTGTATVAVDGLAAITITRRDDSTLQTGDITAGEAVELWYDGNTFRMQGGFSSGLTYASGAFQLGATITSGSAVNQTFRSHNATTGTNISGGNLTIVAPGGTGSSTGGTIAFQTAPVLASGTTAQTPVDRMTIAKDGTVTVGTSIGATTINSLAGSDTNSVVFLGETASHGTVITNDGFNNYTRFATRLSGSDTEWLNVNYNGSTGAFSNKTWTFTAPAGTGVPVTINNGTSTGNILNLQDNGSNVFTVADGGTVTASGAIALNAGGSLAGNHFNVTSSTYGLQFVGIGSSGSYVNTAADMTPDSPVFRVGTLSNSWHITETDDGSYDFNNGPCGTSACTDPALIIHGAAQNTTEYNASAVWGDAGGAVKTLTESAATALVRIPVANNGRASGELVYEIYATDGTDMQVRSSRIRYAMTNKAGTEACTLTAMDGAAATAETDDDNASSLSAGTLTYGIACTNNAADTMDITFNAVSSLTQTTLRATWSVKHLSPGQPARQ